MRARLQEEHRPVAPDGVVVVVLSADPQEETLFANERFRAAFCLSECIGGCAPSRSVTLRQSITLASSTGRRCHCR